MTLHAHCTRRVDAHEHDVLPADRRRDLDEAGFEWISSRACGSAFMKGFRKYRDWRAAAAAGAAPPEDLAVWVAATKAAAAKGKLSAERLDYLGSVAFFETGGGVDDAAFLDDA